MIFEALYNFYIIGVHSRKTNIIGFQYESLLSFHYDFIWAPFFLLRSFLEIHFSGLREVALMKKSLFNNHFQDMANNLSSEGRTSLDE